MCNECKRCDGDRCTYFDNDSDRESTIACILFESRKPTIGDKIRQMSDEGLAKKFVHRVSMKYVNGYVETYWVSGILRNKKWLKEEFAIKATLEELNKEIKDE